MISREWYMFLLTFFTNTAAAEIDLTGFDLSGTFDGQTVDRQIDRQEYPQAVARPADSQEYQQPPAKPGVDYHELVNQFVTKQIEESSNYLVLLQKIKNLESQIAMADEQKVNWLKLPIDLVNFVVEKDGTLVFKNDATVWKDIMFPMAPPKTTGAGNPSLVIWNGNMRGFSFAVNDAHDFDPQEIEHDAKIGSTATWHIHFVSRDNETERTVKYELEYAIEPESGAIPAPTTVSAEFTIAASTTANTPQRGNITTFVIPGIAKLAYARITRIASSGTEPTTDPVVSGLHFHYELDTIGSREIITK
jgi:hypothetical protein